MRHLLLTLALLTALSARAQHLPDTLWTRRYAELAETVGSVILPATDGGFILAGTTIAGESSQWNGWLCKADSQGSLAWLHTYGQPDIREDFAWGFKARDHSFVLCGEHWGSSAHTRQLLLVKSNEGGERLWEQPTQFDFVAHTVQEAHNGDILVGGEHADQSAIARFSAGGDSLSLRTVDVTPAARDYLRCLLELENGDIIAGGSMGGDSAYLLRLSVAGDTVWVHRPAFAATPRTFPFTLCAIPGGDFLVSALEWNENYTDSDLRLIRCTPDGETNWSRTYRLEEDRRFTGPGYVLPEGESGVVVTGAMDYDSGILKVDWDGNLLWGGRLSLYPYRGTPQGLTPAPGGGYYWLLCRWDSPPTVVRLSDDGSATVPHGHVTPLQAGLLPASPNPFNATTRLRYTLPYETPVTLKIYDVLGRELTTLLAARKPAGEHTVTFGAGDLPSGLYFAHLTATGITHTQKLLLLK